MHKNTLVNKDTVELWLHRMKHEPGRWSVDEAMRDIFNNVIIGPGSGGGVGPKIPHDAFRDTRPGSTGPGGGGYDGTGGGSGR